MATSAASRPAERTVEEPFVLTAMLSLVVASVWLAFKPALVHQFYYAGNLLALTHLVTLGFVTSIIMGVSLRLVPMTCRVAPLSFRLGVVQFLLFLIGFTGMVAHFGPLGWLGVAWSAVLVWLAALVQLINFVRLWPRAWSGDWIARHLVAGQLHFLALASLGVSLGMQNAGYAATSGWFAGSILDRLSAHLHLGAVGWVTTIIFGVQLKLVPTTVGAPWQRWPRFALLQVGVVGLTVSLLWALPGPRLFALLIAAAVAWQAWGPLRALRRRRGWLWEGIALGLLVALAATGVALAFDLPQPLSQWRHRVQFAYGFAALYGWILITTGAVALKLFPLWVWQERFAPEFGHKPVPAAYAIASKRLKDVSGAALTVGVIGTCVGIVIDHPTVTSVALKLTLVGVGAFVANFARTARWALLGLEYKP